MINRDILAKFFRYYVVAYRLEHDIDWAKADASFWSYELAVQSGSSSKIPILRKVFKGKNLVADEKEGSVICKAPFCPIESLPSFDEMLSSLENKAKDLNGSKFQIQLLISHKDDELKEDFDREMQWQWLVSSPRICELFILGEIKDNSVCFESCFHSCYQSDHNRDISEDISVMIAQWEKVYKEVASAYVAPTDEKAIMSVLKKENWGASSSEHTYPCESQEEADEIFDTCHKLGVFESRGLSKERHLLRSKLGLIEMVDLVYSRRYARAYQLFGCEVLPE
ncbi:MAG: hypothetical protein ACI376_07045 [Candidatus Bruticola sp.]